MIGFSSFPDLLSSRSSAAVLPPPSSKILRLKRINKMASRDDVDDEDIREQDRLLPIANVARIMKRALPENAKIAKDAKECVQDCVSEFIAFLTSEGKYDLDMAGVVGGKDRSCYRS